MPAIDRFKNKMTKDQSRDTGMGLVLLLLLLATSLRRERLVAAAIAVHVVNMIWPRVYSPLAVIWFGVSEFIGGVMSKVLMGLGFFVIVTPIALVRRLMGRDSLKLRAFKTGQGSVMVERNHRFSPSDLERPF
jgi:hypothetical protein